MLAVPVRRAGRRLGVLVVQNRVARTYTDDEVEVLETVAMVLADVLGRTGATDGAEEGVAATMPRFFSGTVLVPGIVIGPGRAAPSPIRRPPAGRRPRRRSGAAAAGVGQGAARPRRAASAPAPRPSPTARRATSWKPTGSSPPATAGCAASTRRSAAASPPKRRCSASPASCATACGGSATPTCANASPTWRTRPAGCSWSSPRSSNPARSPRARSWSPAASARPSCWTGTPAASPASRSRTRPPAATPRSSPAPSACRAWRACGG